MIVRAESVEKSFNGLQVLKGINLAVAKGEIVSIVGASGAGKSTLLNILGTLEKPDRGKVSINGIAAEGLKGNSLSDFRNRHIGFIFQFHQLLPEFNAAENIAMPALIRGDSKDEAFKRSKDLLELMGLGERAGHKPSELSGGEQQRVAIARALVNNPDLVLADEPSGNLDSENARMLHELFFRLRKDLGQTFIIVTHNPELAEMADRKLIIRDGKIL